MSTSDLDNARKYVLAFMHDRDGLLMGDVETVLSDFEAAVDAKARADERERIARAIETAQLPAHPMSYEEQIAYIRNGGG